MIQYFHKRPKDFSGKVKPKGGNTFFLDVPPKSILEALILQANDPVISMGYGEVECHDLDNYVKSIGRNLALSRGKTVVWTLTDILVHGNQRKLTFFSDEAHVDLLIETTSKIVRIKNVYNHG